MNSNDPKAKVHYIKHFKILRKALKEVKKQYYSRLLAKSDNKIKTTWNIIQKEMGKVYAVEEVPTLHVNNEQLKDPTKMANAFNTFFVAVSEESNIQQIEKRDAISILKDLFAGNFLSIKIISITEAEIQIIIRSLKQKQKKKITRL